MQISTYFSALSILWPFYDLKIFIFDRMRQLIDNDWDKILQEEFEKLYVKTLNDFLLNERKHHQVFPPKDNLFEALKKTPFEKIKVVILGQDPYHQVGQANGLAFSVG